MALSGLAIDVGIMAVAKAQCQNAADAASLAAARSLNGTRAAGASEDDPIGVNDNNYSAAAPAAVTAAGSNTVLGQAIAGGQVKPVIGKYIYDSDAGKFVAWPIDPGSTNDTRYNWSLADVTVSAQHMPHFGGIMNVGKYTVQAEATAVHRPRDVAIVLDFSGSMRFGSLLGIPYYGDRQSNNPETVYPKFGHYSSTSAAGLYQNQSNPTVSGYSYDAANTTASTSLNHNRPILATDFYQTYNSTTLAFTSAGAGDSEGYVSGDKFPKINVNGYYGSTNTYAKTISDLFGSHSTEQNRFLSSSGYNGKKGYDYLYGLTGSTTFQGYTRGPSYWGKTFFMWPPDPRPATSTSTSNQHNNGALDWRQRFFLKSDGSTPVDDNTLLWDSSGDWQSPSVSYYSSNYKINYRAILYWIKNVGPNPFPSQLRAGRILYYDSFPDYTDTSLNTRFWNYNPGSPSGLSTNERFWKDYIDYVLGLCQTGSNSWDRESSSRPSIVNFTGYGGDFTWGSVRITSKPSSYMNTTDNPMRPTTHLWFGPMTMVDFLGSYNMYGRDNYGRYDWMPGTAHEAPMYACKIGIRSALEDIRNNHPNDVVSLIFYSSPRGSRNDSVNRFNTARVPLGREYEKMEDALFFPPSTLDSTGSSNVIRPYDDENKEVPRPSGGTCYSMGLMLAYNQFSGNTDLQTYDPSPAPTGNAGGMGRRGAYKLVILETDGQPNVSASAGFTKVTGSTGANCSYYNIRYNSSNPYFSEYPNTRSWSDNSSGVTSEIFDIAQRICAMETDSQPGFATSRKPVRIHCLAFGPLFAAGSSARDAGLSTLQQIERIGNTQDYSTPDAWLPDYKVVTGDDTEVTNDLRTAIRTIMQDGVQVSLIH